MWRRMWLLIVRGDWSSVTIHPGAVSRQDHPVRTGRLTCLATLDCVGTRWLSWLVTPLCQARKRSKACSREAAQPGLPRCTHTPTCNVTSVYCVICACPKTKTPSRIGFKLICCSCLQSFLLTPLNRRLCHGIKVLARPSLCENVTMSRTEYVLISCRLCSDASHAVTSWTAMLAWACNERGNAT